MRQSWKVKLNGVYFGTLYCKSRFSSLRNCCTDFQKFRKTVEIEYALRSDLGVSVSEAIEAFAPFRNRKAYANFSLSFRFPSDPDKRTSSAHLCMCRKAHGL